MTEWHNEITADDMPDEFKGLMELIGLDNVITVIRYFEGSEQYFPKIDSSFKQVRDRVIKRKWRKHNIAALAKEFNLTHNQIREIVRDHESQLDLIPKMAP